jgi:hypothetical protein
MSENTLGLKEAEITWLRANSQSEEAKSVIRQYQMVVTCPNDPGARGIFSAILDEARKSFLAGLQ